ncbi:MAG: sigma-54-dependent Fis family transcriptional regulator [Candidatus Jettenia sp.]|uniref:Transcriptional regulator n=1 Tax=Candidatus Jettenia caeni TaxID=247490 RepID=I3II78_9BACT|nr:sigma-54 dependent transcriptional regulator [Candidatus Jettenia sp. AMX1]MBC6929234.1 sigma-54-dependent Fis family transcriptional regulator [Candidatus Jettenia sp.]NUN23809.1 sigma-54-dependent Fis family transcriptional regulator [Candidatus Jettenia caeni]KAA0251003.1 MAG: sigma-54-dependent Fis family transcriptional regulator [Candidatus Jettenia sp. AMX1]MCE7880203.1 sigma-54-dependent Fis family transcriptional regulator [Candidatus Jettenia sp. AMX1]MCQ3926373.1 sigma-54-depende
MVQQNILIIDHNPFSCCTENCNQLTELIQSSLFLQQFRFQTTTLFPREPSTFSPDLIIFRPAKETFTEALFSIKKNWGKAPVVCLFCNGWNTSPEIFQSFHQGMDDFLSCPFRETDLLLRIQRLLHQRNSIHTYDCMGRGKEMLNRELLVGESESFLQEIRKIPLYAHSDTPVLISGETGTGKELFARAIHYNSPRRGKPFIPVNCGALPNHLFENELFGHVKGAFTDASSTERGLIAEAEGGTLFLDEINTLSPSAQIKLLRFLQNREYRPLGSSKNRVADVSVIAATNSDLKQCVEAKRFREDLYYRINTFSLSLPPLRERTDDIPLLAAHFLMKYAIQHSRNISQISFGGLQKLLQYHWPGNVRELEGVILRAVITSSSPELQSTDIDLPIHDEQKNIVQYSSFQEAKSIAINDFERTYLTTILTAHQGNITRAAKIAGKERRSFQRLLQKHNLHRDTFQKAV